MYVCHARVPVALPCFPPPLVQTLSGLEKDAEGYMGLAEKWFVFAMVWSVMAAADEMGRVKLDSFLRDVEVGAARATEQSTAERFSWCHRHIARR